MNGSVIVTGAAGGIGRAIVDRLKRAGATVIAADLSPGLADLEGVTPVQVDLTTDEGVAAVVDTARDLEVPLVGLVNNAGITRDARIVNMTDEDFRKVIDVNLGAAYRLALPVAREMADGGSIVNIASRAYLGNFGQFNYTMSKGGIVGLTRALSLSLAPRVRVNAVAPGLIATEMALAIPEDVLAKMVAAIPLDRMGEPTDVAETIRFLLGPESSYITGEVLVVGGGRSLSR
ncbi:MAG: SDR family oxidoreductase [Acidimicrobiales bacterium]|jgi:NAD(P)-dependent dehydrogenase (short-subunit alcohol dehydrogenase family)|nr:SDR family oxidoreductase [Acidimicrobiales bacterium]HLV89516.1 SDR family oxidoreductase [Acidimicrobiia bacterium]